MKKKLLLLGLPFLGVPLFAESITAPAINSGDTAWVLASAALVLLMTVPALALFYGGLVRKKNILSVFAYSLSSALIVTVLWVVGPVQPHFWRHHRRPGRRAGACPNGSGH